MTPRLVTLGVLLAGIVLLGITFYQVIAPFLLPLFLAAIMAILCRPAYLRLLSWTGHRPSLAAGLTTALVMLSLVTPVVIVTLIGTVQIVRLTEGELQSWDWSRGLERMWTDVAEPALKRLETNYPGQFSVEELERGFVQQAHAGMQALAARTLTWASSTVGMVISLLVSGAMFLVAFYFFLADGPHLIAAAETLIPVPAQHQRKLREQFAKVVRAVVMATFFAAFAQGLATATALQVVGMGHFFVFLIAATVGALIPLAGTWLVWGPCAVWLAYQGHWTSAIGLALFGLVVVGLLDNVIRTYVLNSDAQLHPLLAFVSVLGALQVMGLWGIFFGPIIASCLYALVQIFNSELRLAATQGAMPPVMPPVPTVDQTVAAANVAQRAENGQAPPVEPAAPAPVPAAAATRKQKERK
jgi:predicted PurR-regulated permease PerM